MEKQTRAKRTYAMLKEATNGRAPANHEPDRFAERMIMDFRSDIQPEKEEEKSYLEPHMDYSRASIIHTAINIIIYDSIAIFAVTSNEEKQK